MTMLKDPVCGKRIKTQRAHVAVEHEGFTYHLCCPLCQAEFERNPRKYARPELGERIQPHQKEKGQQLRRPVPA